MKAILIITAVFPPEPIVSSRLSFDIVDKLVENYEITVLHPRPSRPYGFSFNERSNQMYKYEEVTADSYVCPQSKLIGRFYESYSFGLHCKKYIERHWNRFSCIYVNSWPLFSQAFIVKTAKRYGVPCIVHVQDIYPESFTNKIKIKAISKIVNFVLLPIDRYILENATHILAVSVNMKSYLVKSRNICKDKVGIVENWQNEDEFIAYEKESYPNVSDYKLSFMYLGNIGPVAGVEFLINSFAKAQLIGTRLIIAGSGSMKKECIELLKKYQDITVEFWDVPDGKVPEIQSKADIMLLPVKKGAAMSSIPSKLPAYMFSRKPIIASLDLQSDTARAIREADCGMIVNPEDEDALIYAMKEAVRRWGNETLMKKGDNGFKYAMNRFSKKANLKQILNIVQKFIK